MNYTELELYTDCKGRENKLTECTMRDKRQSKFISTHHRKMTNGRN